MAYYDANGQVSIDEAAANEDIRKIKEAIVRLKASKDSISKLSNEASSMTGATGAAIVEQCTRLEKKVDDLITQLTSTITYTQKVVAKYKEEDQQLAQNIRNGSGV